MRWNFVICYHVFHKLWCATSEKKLAEHWPSSDSVLDSLNDSRVLLQTFPGDLWCENVRQQISLNDKRKELVFFMDIHTARMKCKRKKWYFCRAYSTSEFITCIMCCLHASKLPKPSLHWPHKKMSFSHTGCGLLLMTAGSVEFSTFSVESLLFCGLVSSFIYNTHCMCHLSWYLIEGWPGEREISMTHYV